MSVKLKLKMEIKKVKGEVVMYKIPSFVIRIPPLVVSRQNLVTSFACLLCFCSISFNTSKVDVTEFTPPDNGIVQIPPIIMDVEDVKMAKAFVKLKPVSTNKSDKMISISDIIKDPKCLNYVCHNEIIKRAINVQKETGLSAVTVIGQKGVESAWGTSSLTKSTKNEGNIKCGCNWNGKLRLAHYNGEFCVRAWDKKEKTNHYYVKTKTTWESWSIYKKLIRKRYMRAARKTCYKQELDMLQNLGYATIHDKNGNKIYSDIISAVIVKYGLDKLQAYLDSGYTITTSNGKYILYEPN